MIKRFRHVLHIHATKGAARMSMRQWLKWALVGSNDNWICEHCNPL